MTDDPAELAGTLRARSMLADSEAAMADILAAFSLMTERMLSDDSVPTSELPKMLTAFGQIRAKLIEEVTKHENRVLYNEGRVAHAPLDFDALRDEIGGKLDRIRAAGDAAEVPE